MNVRSPDVDKTELDAWCRLHLGSAIGAELFTTGYLSRVIGLELRDGRRVVVKARATSSRLTACAMVHHHLFRAGYPCPEPMVGPQPLGAATATAEALVPPGLPHPSTGRTARPFAVALARLVELAPDADSVPALDPAPPWTAWAHRHGRLWPPADDTDVDLNLVGGPAWIDEAAEGARARLQAVAAPPVIGHGDWYSGNFAWDGDRLVAVHDWDSVIADMECVVAGLGAAAYATVRSGEDPTVEETEHFLRDYQAARGRPFSPDELRGAWAAGLWLRAFDAKKQISDGREVRSLTEAEARERMRRAGAP